MNIRNVLRTYGLLRQLSDDETALLETLRGLNESEREQLVESLAPVKAAKKPRKPRGKSARASSMAETLNSNLQQRRREATNDVTGEDQSSSPLCTACGNEEGYQDHFQPSPHSHAFAAPKTAQSAAGD
jgi:hypothetical protein